jgi:vacuolar-type H+-ATPase subunit I/STV1
MATKAKLSLRDLDGAEDIDALPSMLPLLADVERLAAELDGLDAEVQTLMADKQSFSPYKLGKLEEQRRPVIEALAQARLRVDDERTRLQTEIDTLFQPLFLEKLTQLTKALERVAPLDEELRDLEIRRSKFVPFHGVIRPRHSADELRRLARYMEQQRPH